MQKFKKYFFLAFSLSPFFALAATTLTELGQTIITLITGTVMPLLFAIALVYFLVGVVKYIASGGDENKRKEGTQMMLYGIIGLFVMVSVWGLVALLINTFGISIQREFVLPEF